VKFKEALDKNEVIWQDDITKLFDLKTTDTFVELEKTIQKYWNIDRPSGNFLNMMIKIKNAKSALEIGSSNGYSAIWLAKALLETGGKLITVEFWENRLELAIENFKKTGVNEIITPIAGDAVEVLENMKQEGQYKFDFVFMDANKAEYIQYFNAVDPMLETRGVIIADNILSHYKKTKDYVSAVTNNKNYQSQLLNFEAGMMLSTKISG